MGGVVNTACNKRTVLFYEIHGPFSCKAQQLILVQKSNLLLVSCVLCYWCFYTKQVEENIFVKD